MERFFAPVQWHACDFPLFPQVMGRLAAMHKVHNFLVLCRRDSERKSGTSRHQALRLCVRLRCAKGTFQGGVFL